MREESFRSAGIHIVQPSTEQWSASFTHRSAPYLARLEPFSYSAFERAAESGHEERRDLQVGVTRIFVAKRVGATDRVVTKASILPEPTAVLPEARMPVSWGNEHRAYSAAPEPLQSWLSANKDLRSMGFGVVLEMSIVAHTASIAVEGELVRGDDVLQVAELLESFVSGTQLRPSLPPRDVAPHAESFGHVIAVFLASSASSTIASIAVLAGVDEILCAALSFGDASDPLATTTAGIAAFAIGVTVPFVFTMCTYLVVMTVRDRRRASSAARTASGAHRATPYR